ncbi:5' nucleotidase [Phaffia rhodozyma]|uniref:5' nucleotidase n=1 Tax=Phaffia rhodozyma TaxID=264483 RepID=A0A0F7SRF0_PHARH|nr:5' nucleotidase [Phaffia rhodozyma]
MLPHSVLVALLAGITVQIAKGKDDHLVSSDYLSSNLHKRHWDDQGNYNITFIHVNDVHAHLDQYRASGTDCPTDGSVPCLGGYARIMDKTREIRSQVQDSLLFNAGDEFQGTLFYSFYGPQKIAETLNLMNFTLGTLGNHEFDTGNDTLLGEYLSNLTFPTISTNIKTENTLLRSQLKPYHLFPKHELAVVALTTVDTPDISKPGKGTTFGKVLEVQKTVDQLLKKGGVKRVVALTHIGYDQDIELAKNSRNIHLIIGGHSHTPLGGESWYSQGPYPTIVRNLDGEEVFIVTSYRWGEHLGRIDVAFEKDSGKVHAYTGGAIRMTEDFPQDKSLQKLITSWREPFEEFAKVIVGQTVRDLDQPTCQVKECNLGNAVTDSMLYGRRSLGAKVDAALHNSGGLRATIPAPNITQGILMTSFPFNTQLVDIKYTGKELWEIFEGVCSGVNSVGKTVTSSVQVAGIKYSWNPKNAPGSKLISLQIGSPEVEDVDFEKTYTIVTLDFLATGGDSILPRPFEKSPPPIASQDEVFIEYIRRFSPLDVDVEGRIVVTDEETPEHELGQLYWRENTEVDAEEVTLKQSLKSIWESWWRGSIKFAKWE